MPHIHPFYTKDGKTVIKTRYDSMKKFEKHLVKTVLDTFNPVCSEEMTKHNVLIHPFTITSSMPIDIELVIVAWDTPERHAHRFSLEYQLRMAILPGHLAVPWQMNLIFAGDRRMR